MVDDYLNYNQNLVGLTPVTSPKRNEVLDANPDGTFIAEIHRRQDTEPAPQKVKVILLDSDKNILIEDDLQNFIIERQIGPYKILEFNWDNTYAELRVGTITLQTYINDVLYSTSYIRILDNALAPQQNSAFSRLTALLARSGTRINAENIVQILDAYFGDEAWRALEFGDMLASIYDPTSVEGDVFNLENHTGLLDSNTATVDAGSTATPGAVIKIKRKSGGFAGGDLSVGELGLDITNKGLYGSVDGVDVINFTPVPVTTYVHSQAVGASSWNIAHNMGFYPNILVKDTGGSIVYGSITYSDLNNVIIDFNGITITGTAYLS